MSEVKIYINPDPNVNDGKDPNNFQSLASGAAEVPKAATTKVTPKKVGAPSLADQAKAQAKKAATKQIGKVVGEAAGGGIKGKVAEAAAKKGADMALTGIFAAIPGGPIIKKIVIVPGYPEFPILLLIGILSLFVCCFKYWWLSLILLGVIFLGRFLAGKGKIFLVVRILAIVITLALFVMGAIYWVGGGPFGSGKKD